MTGDQNDIITRLKALLPRGWFPDVAPFLTSSLIGAANALSFIYSLIVYARAQCRIRTATDGFLDLISYDYFGNNLPRYLNESDPAFKTRILANLLTEKVTRAGIIKAVTLLTGVAPLIFEPGNIGDTGAYNKGTFAYGMAGGWGSLALKAQFFMKVTPPPNAGVPNVGGWGNYTGGYGIGATEYINESLIYNEVPDSAIYQTIANTKAAGVKAWVQIT